MELIKSLIGNTNGALLMGIRSEGQFRHVPVCDSDEAESVASKYADCADVYMSCAVFDSSGKRTKDHVVSVNAFWSDIDCGHGKPYAHKKDAIAALSTFCNNTCIPKPTHINDSGNGLHVFWALDRPLSRQEWEEKARVLRELTHIYGFKVDDSRTTDVASVLRMPGTLNHKDASNLKPVVSKRALDPIPLSSFLEPLEAAYNKIRTSSVVGTEPNHRVVDCLLKYMARNEPRLHAGTWEYVESDLGSVGYPSQSEADYAYLGKCVRQALDMGIARADVQTVVLTAFRQSALYRESKEHTLEPAIKKLIADLPKDPPLQNALTNQRRFCLKSGVIEVSDELPPPRDWVIKDLVLAGKSTVLGGAGGVSKTQLALQMVCSVALGRSILGRSISQGKTIAFLGEDDSEECSRRINAHAKTLGLSDLEKQQLSSAVRVFPMIGQDTRLSKPMAGAQESTGFAEEIVLTVREFQALDGIPVRLIVLDHAGLLHGGDFNAREDVVQTMNLVNFIAAETGAAVLLLAHTSKSAARKDDEATADDIAGNAAWVDMSRCVLMLRTLTETESRKFGISADSRKQYASLNMVKSNYAPIGETIWLSRRSVDGYGVGILDQVDLKPVDKSKPSDGSDLKLRTRIKELVNENKGLTKNKIVNFSGKDNRLKASKASVSAEVDLMLNDGSLYLEPPTDEEKKRLGINANTSGLLRIGKEQK